MIYAVANGFKTGLFDTWEECKEQVNGFKNAKYKKFKTKKEANLFLKENGVSIIKIISEDLKNEKPEELKKFNEILDRVSKMQNEINYEYDIMVDGACSGNPGCGEYQITDAYGITLFKEKYDKATNNLMEFLALAKAIEYIYKENLDNKTQIWADSVTALSWIKNKKINTSLKMDSILKNDIKDCLDFLKSIDLNNFKIRKWNTKEWGEIPADFGRK